MSEVTVKGAHNTTETASSAVTKKAPGLAFRRFFTKPGVSPYDEVEWERRTAQITDAPKTGR
jgi:ribonucleoside-diphosphate reductase alpha chain